MTGNGRNDHLINIAAILEELSHEIEQLGARLCSDPAIIGAHIMSLQAIDLIAQKQQGLAELLRAECATTGIAAIGVEELQCRLLADQPSC
ncbi:MAG: hypothetical protein ABJA20_08690 [Novosphingobium sp.]